VDNWLLKNILIFIHKLSHNYTAIIQTKNRCYLIDLNGMLENIQKYS